ADEVLDGLLRVDRHDVRWRVEAEPVVLVVLRSAKQALWNEAADVVVVLREPQAVLHVSGVHIQREPVARLAVQIRAQRYLSLVVDGIHALLAQEVAADEILGSLRAAADVEAVARAVSADEDAVLLEWVERLATRLLTESLRHEVVQAVERRIGSEVHGVEG